MNEDRPRAPRHEDYRGRAMAENGERSRTYGRVTVSDYRPHGLWPELRTWPMRAQIGAAALAASLIASAFVIPAFFGGYASSDESEWPGGTIPAAGGVHSGDGETGTETGGDLPPGVEPYDGDPLWTVDVDEEGDQVSQLDDGSLLRTDGALRRLDADGAVVWEHTWEDFSPAISVGAEVVVVSSDVSDIGDSDYEWPGRQDTVALDLETGDEVWHDAEASFVTPFADAVYMTECTGVQEDNIGDCTLYERDPATLSTRWSVATYASAQVVGSGSWTGEDAPERLIVESFPTGHDSRTVTVYENGSELVSVPTLDTVRIIGEMLLSVETWDGNPADGCTAHLTAYRFGSSEPAWEAEAAMRKSDDLVYCGKLPTLTAEGGKLPLTIDDRPAVVDVATGETVWTAPVEGQAYALSPDADALIVVDWEAEEDNMAAYEIDSGEERWRATVSIDDSSQATTIGRTLWIYGNASMWGWSDYRVFGYDLSTGEGLALPGGVGYFAPGEIVTVDGDYDDERYQAWPVDLFE